MTAYVAFSVIPTSSYEYSGEDRDYIAIRKSPDHRISSVDMYLHRISDGARVWDVSLTLYPDTVPQLGQYAAMHLDRC